jgi:hypothetical protein
MAFLNDGANVHESMPFEIGATGQTMLHGSHVEALEV